MRILAAVCALLAAFCSATGTEAFSPGPRGSLLIDVYPNPIIAKQLSRNLYEFPFEVSLREVGGMDVELDGIRVEVKLRGLPIFAQTFDETELTRRGYSATVPAAGNVQYRFSPRREVPTDMIFTHVSATVMISGLDRLGRRTEASTTVTVSPK